ncbi:MAG: hypothetical protein M1827_001675 [Pycnora praestabilis]|nr:MAG: hypothetical protein M1827_001675 [Pycnora praestabilis]
MVDDDCPIIPAAVGGINGRWCCNWLASNGSCAFGDEFTVSPIGQVELVANVAAFNSTTSFGRLTAYASSGNAPTSRITSVPSLATNGSTTADTSIVGTNETLHVGCTSFTSAVVTNGSTTTASGDQYGATVTVTAWSSTWSDSGQSATQCNTSYASILAATNDTRRTDFAIAAGIGFPLGLAFLGVLCLYLRERQRRRKEQNEMIELQVASRKEPQRTTAAGIASRKHNNNRGHGRRLVGRAVELPATVHELPETSSVDIPIVFGPSNDPWI